jgi:hypothetical protein
VWVVKSKSLGPKVKQGMRFVVKDVEEFENFKRIRNLSLYGKK